MPTALVTGASSGIGLDLATVLAKHHYDLVLVSRNMVPMERLRDSCIQQFSVRAEIIPKDLSDPAAPLQIFQELAAKSIPIDILVNNAGFGIHGPFAQTDLQAQIQLLHVNVIALLQLCRLFLPPMIQRRQGRILNVASTAAWVPGPFLNTYYASKAFVLSHSIALAHELRHTGVTVTALCPGPTRTDFQRRAGLDNARLFRLNTMNSLDVAEFAYAAMIKGKTIAVPGLLNRIGITLSRLAPFKLSAKVAARLNGE